MDPRRGGKNSGCGVTARPTGALGPLPASSGARTPSIPAGGAQILGDGALIYRGGAAPAWLLGLDDTNADDEATSGRHSLPTLRGLELSHGGSPFEQEQRGAPPRRIYIRALGAARATALAPASGGRLHHPCPLSRYYLAILFVS